MRVRVGLIGLGLGLGAEAVARTSHALAPPRNCTRCGRRAAAPPDRRVCRVRATPPSSRHASAVSLCRSQGGSPRFGRPQNGEPRHSTPHSATGGARGGVAWVPAASATQPQLECWAARPARPSIWTWQRSEGFLHRDSSKGDAVGAGERRRRLRGHGGRVLRLDVARTRRVVGASLARARRVHSDTMEGRLRQGAWGENR